MTELELTASNQGWFQTLGRHGDMAFFLYQRALSTAETSFVLGPLHVLFEEETFIEWWEERRESRQRRQVYPPEYESFIDGLISERRI